MGLRGRYNQAFYEVATGKEDISTCADSYNCRSV